MNKPVVLTVLLTALALPTASCVTNASNTAGALSRLPRIAQVDERFQSYNVEMVEVTRPDDYSRAS